jgi:hypothetical protein
MITAKKSVYTSYKNMVAQHFLCCHDLQQKLAMLTKLCTITTKEHGLR